ncbi:MAG: 50S ribosomal protein L22 [Acidobacteria bacterium]|nr:50S ribosomal protein L22 [Acidobacteriota bacterium]
MEAIAKTKYLKGSPRKARLVIDLIRGQNVSRALSILKFTDKRAADPIAQCLNSAIANATYKAEQQNIAIDPDDLWINTCFVDMGPTKGRKRMRPAPQGRAYREQRHYCHITIQVTSDEQPKTEKELRAEAAKARKAEAASKEKGKGKKAKAAPKKETKKAKAETAPVADPLVPTPVEPTAQDMNAAADKAAAPVDEKPMEVATVEAAKAEEAKAEAEAANAKSVETQTTATVNETLPADEKLQDTNEELEKQ